MDPSVIGLMLLQGVTGAYNTYQQDKTNKQNRKNELEDYERTRQDTLEDWERTNAYNHPLQQMTRLRQAGLNPNLVYGKGADTTAGSIQSPTKKTSQMAPLQLDTNAATTALSAAADIQLKQTQTDNLAVQAQLMEKEAQLKDATTAKVAQETATNKFQLEQSQRLKDLTVEEAILRNEEKKANIDATGVNTYIQLSRNEREQMKNTVDIQKTLQDILSSRISNAKTVAERKNLELQMENLKKEGQLKQIDIDLRKAGLSPSDPSYQRIMLKFLQDPAAAMKEVAKFGSKLLGTFRPYGAQ